MFFGTLCWLDLVCMSFSGLEQHIQFNSVQFNLYSSTLLTVLSYGTLQQQQLISRSVVQGGKLPGVLQGKYNVVDRLLCPWFLLKNQTIGGGVGCKKFWLESVVF